MDLNDSNSSGNYASSDPEESSSDVPEEDAEETVEVEPSLKSDRFGDPVDSQALAEASRLTRRWMRRRLTCSWTRLD